MSLIPLIGYLNKVLNTRGIKIKIKTKKITFPLDYKGNNSNSL